MKVKYFAIPLTALGLAAIEPELPSIRDKVYESLSGKETTKTEIVAQNPSRNGLEKLLGGITYAQDASPTSLKKISIEDYYRRAEPADEIMPGLRVQNFGYARITTHGFTFFDKEWEDYYINNKGGKGTQMQEIFRQLNGANIKYDGTMYKFDFEAFNRYWQLNKDKVRDVSFRNGFLHWTVPEEKKNYLIPLGKEIKEAIQRLGW